MKNLPTFIVGAVAVLALLIASSAPSADFVRATAADAVNQAKDQFGALVGPIVNSYLQVNGAFTQGGGRIAIDPVDATYTLTFADMNDNNLITFVASTTQPALTLTTMSSSTFPLPTYAGAMRTWVIENPFTAAATTTTIAAGTGVDLQEPDGQNVVIGINNYAFLTCIRGADSGAPEDIVCAVDETIPAD